MYRELVAGDKEHKLLRRALLKEIAILEEEEKKKVTPNSSLLHSFIAFPSQRLLF